MLVLLALIDLGDIKVFLDGLLLYVMLCLHNGYSCAVRVGGQPAIALQIITCLIFFGGFSMNCKLRLNKTQMYSLVKSYYSGIPALRDCYFYYHQSTYFLSFPGPYGNHIRACLATVLGDTILNIFDVDRDSDLRIEHLSYDYLLERGFLRQVS